MNIGVIGTGYVGLVQGIVMAQMGLNVMCMDVDKKKINDLKNGIVPIYEPGLKELLDHHLETKRIDFTTDMAEIINFSTVLFIAVGTPANEDGSADLEYVENVAHEIGKLINNYKVIVTKSTVPVGTGKIIKGIIRKEIEARNCEIDFDIVSNPEFLREGKALQDCLNPNRIVIGCETEKAKEIMNDIYGSFNTNQPPIVNTNIETSEMIKYASNAFLAVKISFINEMALLSEKVGADVQTIARVMGMDGRISPKFLHAGPGYGGSCFPKDTKAIVSIAKNYGESMLVIDAAIKANEKQKNKMVEKVIDKLGVENNINGRVIGILGLSFKPETDDMRDAPSIDIIKGLIKAGAQIQAYCPKGIKESKWRLIDYDASIKYMNDEYECSKGCDAMILMTEWSQFRGMDINRIKNNMKNNYFFDFRGVFSKKKELMESIFDYYTIGN